MKLINEYFLILAWMIGVCIFLLNDFDTELSLEIGELSNPSPTVDK